MRPNIQHLAIIMDGNRRWAKKHHLSVAKGHQAGVLALEKTVKACDELGIKYLTVYGFSTENWQRPKTEIVSLIKIIGESLKQYTELLAKKNWQINFIGRIK